LLEDNLFTLGSCLSILFTLSGFSSHRELLSVRNDAAIEIYADHSDIRTDLSRPCAMGLISSTIFQFPPGLNSINISEVFRAGMPVRPRRDHTLRLCTKYHCYSAKHVTKS
jgi:hypothetical protein